MPTESTGRARVVIIEQDAPIRGLIAAGLQHAGFKVHIRKEARPATAEARNVVIVRDLPLRASESDGAIRELMSLGPEVLRRTVVITTAPKRATEAVGEKVFAVVGKPFDLEKLIETVSECAQNLRTFPESLITCDLASPEKMDSLRRFVRNAPSLGRVLATPVTSSTEAVLCAEMRRTIRALAATLDEVAQSEAGSKDVALFRAAHRAATTLASTTSAEATNRDH